MGQLLLFLNISGGEILLIVVVVYLVFGPKKIPELARMLGKGINELRRATEDIKKEFNQEVSSFKKDVNVDVDIDLDESLNDDKSQKRNQKKEKEQKEEKSTKEDVKKKPEKKG